VLEVTASNNHFDKRFAHLKEIEFIANSKYVRFTKNKMLILLGGSTISLE